jgi:hypothetical protein
MADLVTSTETTNNRYPLISPLFEILNDSLAVENAALFIASMVTAYYTPFGEFTDWFVAAFLMAAVIVTATRNFGVTRTSQTVIGTVVSRGAQAVADAAVKYAPEVEEYIEGTIERLTGVTVELPIDENTEELRELIAGVLKQFGYGLVEDGNIISAEKLE